MINAKILADSRNEHGDRITTMLVTFPRIILAELNTHRAFSRNSASSRAIPFERIVEMVKLNPFIPIAWQKDHKGMQGTEYITDQQVIDYLTKQWLFSRNCAIDAAERMKSNDCTKQIINRLLEPFMWHTAIITSTEWENFFALRCPQYEYYAGEVHKDKHKFERSWKDYIKAVKELGFDERAKELESASILERLQNNKGQAEIHMMALAEAMWDAMNNSVPYLLPIGKWHIPYGDDIDEAEIFSMFETDGGKLDALGYPKYKTREDVIEEYSIKIATARCARVSYTTIEGEKEITLQRLVEIHNRMANQVPFHASPFEHCAMSSAGRCRNFEGFDQYRAILENGKTN